MRAPGRVFILGFVFLVANIALADKVTIDFDRNVNLSKYKTFKWVEQPTTQDAFMGERIMQAVNAQLTARGLRPVQNGADLAIKASLTTEEVQTYNTYYSSDGWGYGWGWGSGWATTTVDTSIVGTLAVNLFDSRTQKAVWQGVGTDGMSRHPEKRTKTVAKMVMKMFREFPPYSGTES